MLFQTTVQLIVLSDIVQESLTRLPEELEVRVEVIRKSHPIIILKMLVQQLQDVVEGVLLLSFGHIEVFKEPPCWTTHRAHYVQNGLTTTFRQNHLLMIEGDSFAVLFVVRWSSWKERYIAVPGRIVEICLGATIARQSWHRSCPRGSPGQTQWWSKDTTYQVVEEPQVEEQVPRSSTVRCKSKCRRGTQACKAQRT